MKDFDYYKSDYKSLQSIRRMVYAKHAFNPELIDSKTEEELIRSKLEQEAQTIYKNMLQSNADKMEEFKRDLFEALDIEDNPKRELLYEKAWEMGHAYGLAEVYCKACDIVDLIL